VAALVGIDSLLIGIDGLRYVADLFADREVAIVEVLVTHDADR
jgi:hypothetical protein